MTYTTQALVEAYLERSLTANEITLLDLLGDAVEGYINDQVNSSFGSVSPSTKYYDGGSKIIDIDPCTNITRVALVDVDENELYVYDLDDELETRPYNETVKTYLERRNYPFPEGVVNIAVTAKFSRGTIPNDIKWLATYLVASMFQTNNKENLKSESIEGYSRAFGDSVVKSQQAQMILEKYNKDDILI